MSRLITGIRLRKDRDLMLTEKAMNLTVKRKDYIKESDIINFLIDNYIETIDVDKEGLFINEKLEKDF